MSEEEMPDIVNEGDCEFKFEGSGMDNNGTDDEQGVFPMFLYQIN